MCTRLPIHVPILSYRAPVCGWPAVTQSPGHGGGGWGGVMMMLLMVMMMVMIMDLIAQLTKRSLTMSGKRGKQRRITIPIYRGKTETLRGWGEFLGSLTHNGEGPRTHDFRLQSSFPSHHALELNTCILFIKAEILNQSCVSESSRMLLKAEIVRFHHKLTGLESSGKAFAWFVFWSNYRRTGKYTEVHKEVPCTFHPASPNVNILHNYSMISKWGHDVTKITRLLQVFSVICALLRVCLFSNMCTPLGVCFQ